MTWTVTAFLDSTFCWAQGPAPEVVERLRAQTASVTGTLLVFDDRTGRNVDFDLRGSAESVQQRLREHPLWPQPPVVQPRKRGRPKLGVVSREISLLPRHWDWLASQRGSTSAVLRRLIDAELKRPDPETSQRRAIERAHTFLWALGGDFPAFEEATRALFAGDTDAFALHTQSWPADVMTYVSKLMRPRPPITQGA